MLRVRVGVLLCVVLALSSAAKFNVPAGVVPEGLAWWRGPGGNSPRLCVSSFSGQGVLLFDEAGNSQGSIKSTDVLAVTAGLFVSGDQLLIASDLAFPPVPNTADQSKVNVFNLVDQSELYSPGIFTSEVHHPDPSIPALGNDVSMDQFGVIYATDSFLGQIYKIQNAGANTLNITLLSDSSQLGPSSATTQFTGVNGCAPTQTSSPAETTLVCSYSGPLPYAQMLKVHATFGGVSVKPTQLTLTPLDSLWAPLSQVFGGADGIRFDSRGFLYMTGYDINTTWVTRFQSSDNWDTARPLQMSYTSAPQVTSVAVAADNTVWALSNNQFSGTLPAVVETMSFNPSSNPLTGVFGAPGTNGFLSICVDYSNNVWGSQNGYRYLEGTAVTTSATGVTLTGWFVDSGELAAYPQDQKTINKYVLNKAKLGSYGRFSLVYDAASDCLEGQYSYGTTSKLTETWPRACRLTSLMPSTTECLQPFMFNPSFVPASTSTPVSDGGPVGSFAVTVANAMGNNLPGTMSLCSGKKGALTGSYTLPNGTAGYISGQCYLSGRVCAANFYQSGVSAFGPMLLRVLDTDHLVGSAITAGSLLPSVTVARRLSPLYAQQVVTDTTTALLLITRTPGTSQPGSVSKALESDCKANQKMRSKWVKSESDGLSVTEIVALSVVVFFIIVLIGLGLYVLLYGRPGGGGALGWGGSGSSASSSAGVTSSPAHGTTGYRGFDDSKL